MKSIRIMGGEGGAERVSDNNDPIGAIDAFLSSLELRGLSPATVRTRRDGLKRFSQFLDAAGLRRIQDLSAESLLRYAGELHAAGLTENSIQVYLISLRQFTGWLARTGRLFEDPALALPAVRRTRRLPRVPARDQVKALLARPDTRTALGLRNRALLEFLYGSGTRISETVGVDVTDMRLDEGTVRIHGKGNRTRVVPLSRPCSRWVGRYLQEARGRLLPAGVQLPALWISDRGRRLGRSTVEIFCRQYCREAGILPPIPPHGLRRAMATHMLQNGASPLVIQRILGHADLSHLGQYLRLSILDLRDMHRRSLPGS